jgi:hypothetical protein
MFFVFPSSEGDIFLIIIWKYISYHLEIYQLSFGSISIIIRKYICDYPKVYY